MFIAQIGYQWEKNRRKLYFFVIAGTIAVPVSSLMRFGYLEDDWEFWKHFPAVFSGGNCFLAIVFRMPAACAAGLYLSIRDRKLRRNCCGIYSYSLVLGYTLSWVMRRVGVRCRQCSHDKNTMVVVVIMVTELERREEGSERWGRCGGNSCKTKFINSFTSM